MVNVTSYVSLRFTEVIVHQARFPLKRNRLRCINENRKKRKRLRWKAANHGCHCFDRAFLLVGAYAYGGRNWGQSLYRGHRPSCPHMEPPLQATRGEAEDRVIRNTVMVALKASRNLQPGIVYLFRLNTFKE